MLVNFNYTMLKCDKCQQVYKLLPGEKYEKLEVECDCEKKPEPKKRTYKKKAVKDATT